MSLGCMYKPRGVGSSGPKSTQTVTQMNQMIRSSLAAGNEECLHHLNFFLKFGTTLTTFFNGHMNSSY